MGDLRSNLRQVWTEATDKQTRQQVAELISIYMQTGEPPDEDIITNVILKDASLAYLYMQAAMKNNHDIPEIILKTIAENSTLAEPAFDVMEKENFDKKIIKNFAKYVGYKQRLSAKALQLLGAENLTKEVLDAAIKFMGDHPSHALKYAEKFGWDKLPKELAERILDGPDGAAYYASNVLKGKDVPQDLIDKISYGTDTSLMYAKNVLKGKDVPDKIIQTITEIDDIAFEYAEFLADNGIEFPENFIKYILKNGYAYQFIREFGWKNIPKEHVHYFFKNMNTAMSYALDVLGGKNVPQEIIDLLSKDRGKAFSYAKKLGTRNVPEDILRSIFKDRDGIATEYISELYQAYERKLNELHEQGVISKDDIQLFQANTERAITDEYIQSFEKIKDVLKDPSYAMAVAYHVLHGVKLPDYMIDTIAKVPPYADMLVKSFGPKLKKENEDQFNKLKNAAVFLPYNALNYVMRLFKQDKITEIPEKFVDSIATEPRYVHDLLTSYGAWGKLKKIPDKFVQALSEDLLYAYRVLDFYESKLGIDGVPKELINIVYKDMLKNYGYQQHTTVVDFVKRFLIPLNGTVPEEFLDVMGRYPTHSSSLIGLMAFLISKNIKLPTSIIKSIMKTESEFDYFVGQLLHDAGEIPDYVMDEISKNGYASLQYAKRGKWENIPKDIFEAATDYLADENNETTNYNIVEKFPQLHYKFKDNKHYKRWYGLPMQYAEEHNRLWGGLLFHSMDSESQAQFTLEVKDDKELCISTFDSHQPFRGGVILVGRGPIRLLFDFDCYSHYDEDGLRYATASAQEILNMDVKDIENLSKEKRLKRAGFEEIGDHYYDEGFIRPSKVEWLFVTGYRPDLVKRVSEQYDLPTIDTDEFNKIIKKGNLTLLYDILQGKKEKEIEPGPEEYDDYSTVQSKSDKLRSMKRGGGRKPRSKKVKRMDKYRDFALEEEELTLNECVKRKISKIWDL